MTLPMMTLAATLAAMNPEQRTAAEFTIFVNAVAAVESGNKHDAIGDSGHARGAWQLHLSAWTQANRWRKSKGMESIRWDAWRDRRNQYQIAHAYLSWCKERLAANGRPTDWETVYMAYTWGLKNFEDAGWDATKAPAHKQRAAARVGDICRQLTK